MVKFMCECGSTEFEIEAKTHDIVTFGVVIDVADGSFNTTYDGKEHVYERDYHTDYADMVECIICSRVYKLEDIKKGIAHEKVA